MNCDNCGKECENRYCSRKCWLEVAAPKLIDRAGFNIGEYRNMKMSTFKAAVSLTSRINKYVDTLAGTPVNELKGLYIYGSVGTGKTHLMVALGREIIERCGLPIMFIHMPEWIGRFYGDMRNRDTTMLQTKITSVLLIDDLGTEQQTDYTIPIICELLDYRWTRKLLTYFTSNLTPEHWKKIDPRIISRISGMTKSIMLDGKDWRASS